MLKTGMVVACMKRGPYPPTRQQGVRRIDQLHAHALQRLRGRPTVGWVCSCLGLEPPAEGSVPGSPQLLGAAGDCWVLQRELARTSAEHGPAVLPAAAAQPGLQLRDAFSAVQSSPVGAGLPAWRAQYPACAAPPAGLGPAWRREQS